MFGIKQLFNFAALISIYIMALKDKKAIIIEAAATLFSQKGFEGTSMRDISSAADVNLAMINYYFGSKEKLFEAVMVTNSEYLNAFLLEILKDDELSSMDKMNRLIDYQVKRLREKREFHKLMHHEIMLNQRMDVSEIIKAIIQKNSVLLREVIEQGIQNGSFRQVDVPLVIATLFGTLNQLFLSNTICKIVFNKCNTDADPIDDALTQRLSDYLKDLMRAVLVKV